jgi:hypothetical protein
VVDPARFPEETQYILPVMVAMLSPSQALFPSSGPLPDQNPHFAKNIRNFLNVLAKIPRFAH